MQPDLNDSSGHFAPARDGQSIRFGLAAIKGVGEVALETILKARSEGGKFTSLADLCERVDGRLLHENDTGRK